MPTRIELHDKLVEILGSENVYFQPPESVKMHYPAIVYNLEPGFNRRADNHRYIYRDRYSVTVVDKNPEAQWYKELPELFDYCDFDRWFVTDNLNHWAFTLYW